MNRARARTGGRTRSGSGGRRLGIELAFQKRQVLPAATATITVAVAVAVPVPARLGVLLGVFPALLQGLEQIDALAALDLQLTDGLVQGLLDLCLGGELGRKTIGVVVVDCLEGGAPGAKGFVFVVLEGGG